MLYIKAVDQVRFVPGIKIPEWAVYVRVTSEGKVIDAGRPKFYRDIESDTTLKKHEQSGNLTVIR